MDARSQALEFITTTWKHFITKSPLYIWEQKLKLANVTLKIWAKNSYKQLDQEEKEL